MKKIFATIAIAAALCATSCSEDFLEVLPEANYTGETYYTSDDAVLKALQPLYGRAWWGFNYRGTLGIGSYRANDAWNPYNSPEFSRFQTTALTDEVLRTWSSLYTVISMSNSILKDVTENCGEDVSEDIREQAKGTAHLMRATAYFYLVRTWGPCIIILDNDAAVANPQMPLNPEEDVFKQIVKDLYSAIDCLPETSSDGYVNKYAAEGLLAKVLLARSGWNGGSRDQDDLNECVRLCEDVIDNGPFSLLPDYQDLFKYENFHQTTINNECMMAMLWADPLTGGWGETNVLYSDLCSTYMCEDVMCWGGVTASIDMVDMYNECKSDKRWDAIFFFPGQTTDWMHKNSGGFTYEKNWMQVKKYCVGNASDVGGHLQQMESPLNTYIMRYADLLMIHAEASLGNNSALTGGRGLDSWNAVLTRAGKPVVGSLTFEDILRERRIEFCMEYCNWFDMVSWYQWKPEYMIGYFNKSQHRGIILHEDDMHMLSDGTMNYTPVNYLYWDQRENEGQGESVKIWKYDMDDDYNNLGLNPFYSLDQYMSGYWPNYDIDGNPIGDDEDRGIYVPVNVTSANIFLPYPEADVLQNPYLSQDPVPYDFGE